MDNLQEQKLFTLVLFPANVQMCSAPTCFDYLSSPPSGSYNITKAQAM